MKVIFFGSTSDSVIVLEKLSAVCYQLSAIVTQPPRPVGRKQVLTPTSVEIWAKAHAIPTLSFPSNPDKPWLYESEMQVIDTLQPLKADILVSACYGQRIPIQAIQAVRFGGLNVHPSLLPRWRGADPVPWAILSGDHQTGVTIVTLSETFDDGRIISQKKIPITDNDTSDAIRTKLFTIGAQLLEETLTSYTSDVKAVPHIGGVKPQGYPYARRLTREDGFEPWEAIQKAFEDPEEAKRIDRKFRAFFPWPGVWTLLRQGYGGQAKEQRLKILSLHLSPTPDYLLLDTVQLEGKKPIPYSTLLTAASLRLHLD